MILHITICCTDKRDKCEFIDAKYDGLWAETMWTYEFKPNGQFTFKASGHYGNVVDSGFYMIRDSIVLLSPRSDWQVVSGVLKTKLKIINSGCLRDFSGNFYCASIDDINELNDSEFGYRDSVEGILDTMHVVRIERERIESRYQEPHIDIVYNGIIVIENEEFHEFSLTNYTISTGLEVYLSFFATKKPFDIFEYDPMTKRMNSILESVE